MNRAGIIRQFAVLMGPRLRVLICLTFIVNASFHLVETGTAAAPGCLVQMAADQPSNAGAQSQSCDGQPHLTCTTSVMCHVVALAAAPSLIELDDHVSLSRAHAISLHGRNLLPLLHPPKLTV